MTSPHMGGYETSTAPPRRWQRLGSRLTERPDEDVRIGDKARALKRSPRRGVRGITPRSRNPSELAAKAFQLLDEIAPVSAAPMRLVHFHIDVAVRRVVVKEDPTLTHGGSSHFERPFTAAGTLSDRLLDFGRGREAS